MTRTKNKHTPAQQPPKDVKKFLDIELTTEFNFRRFRKLLYLVLSAATFLASVAMVINDSTWSPFNLVVSHITFMMIFASTILELLYKDMVVADLKDQLKLAGK